MDNHRPQMIFKTVWLQGELKGNFHCTREGMGRNVYIMYRKNIRIYSECLVHPAWWTLLTSYLLTKQEPTGQCIAMQAYTCIYPLSSIFPFSIVLHCTRVMHCTLMYFTALHSSALHSTALHFIQVLHCTAFSVVWWWEPGITTNSVILV